MSLISQKDLVSKSRDELCGLLVLAFRAANAAKPGTLARRRALAGLKAIQAELAARGPAP